MTNFIYGLMQTKLHYGSIWLTIGTTWQFLVKVSHNEILRKSVKWFRHSYWQTWPPYKTFILLSHMCSIYEKVLWLWKTSILRFSLICTISASLKMKRKYLHIRKYCDGEKYISRLWQIYTKVCFWNAASSIYIYTYIHMTLAGASMVEWILSIFSIWEFFHNRSVPGECEYSNPKNRSP
jgi:hypothetical protein